jgi:ABC-type dipeptide/oligopeptide/nickel transport system permease component
VRRYIIRRLLQSVFILFILSIVVFALLRVAPGANPALVICGINCPKERLAALEEQMGLKGPRFPVSVSSDPPFMKFHGDSQYGNWIRSLFESS